MVGQTAPPGVDIFGVKSFCAFARSCTSDTSSSFGARLPRIPAPKAAWYVFLVFDLVGLLEDGPTGCSLVSVELDRGRFPDTFSETAEAGSAGGCARLWRPGIVSWSRPDILSCLVGLHVLVRFDPWELRPSSTFFLGSDFVAGFLPNAARCRLNQPREGVSNEERSS